MGFLQQKDGWRESIKETGKLRILSKKYIPYYLRLL